jgi:hypothetical protein
MDVLIYADEIIFESGAVVTSSQSRPLYNISRYKVLVLKEVLTQLMCGRTAFGKRTNLGT